jgi:single-strand DNA-binding protein
MNTLRNKVRLIGRLGAQPEVVKLDSGTMLARFSMATHENYRSKDGEWHEKTQWHSITAWGGAADRVAKLLTKGQEVLVEGKIVNNSYETKDGEKRFSTTIELNDFLTLSPRQGHDK